MENSVGRRLEHLLLISNMNQRELADKVGVNEVTISRYIHGKRIPRLEVVAKIAEVLGTSTDYLLGMVTYPNEHKKSGADVHEELRVLKIKEYVFIEDLNEKELKEVKSFVEYVKSKRGAN